MSDWSEQSEAFISQWPETGCLLSSDLDIEDRNPKPPSLVILSNDNLFYVSGCLACMHVCVACACLAPGGSQKMVRIPWDWIIDGGDPLCGC